MCCFGEPSIRKDGHGSMNIKPTSSLRHPSAQQAQLWPGGVSAVMKRSPSSAQTIRFELERCQLQLRQQSREVPAKRTSRNRHKCITSSTVMLPGMKHSKEFRQRYADRILASCLSRCFGESQVQNHRRQIRCKRDMGFTKLKQLVSAQHTVKANNNSPRKPIQALLPCKARQRMHEGRSQGWALMGQLTCRPSSH